MTGEQFLKTKIDGATGFLIVDRPALRGAFNSAMWDAFPKLLTELADSPEVRVIVVRGTEGHFIAGADISEFANLRADPALARAYDNGAVATMKALETLSVPTIAMIEGNCIGGGCLVAFACDLRIAADSARLGIPAGKLGLAYPYAGIERLVATVGEAEALALTLSARLLDGRRAHTCGLVQFLADADDIEAETDKLARDVSANAPLAMTYLRRAIRRNSRWSADDETIEALADACFASEDYKEGVAAFMEKRRARFRGC